MKSKLFIEEKVKNEERKFGEANEYYPVRIEYSNDNIQNALFTESELKIAIERAGKNPEDIPDKTIWESLVNIVD